ncbi:hypothetical protein JMN32_16710 [Fulvivirga sp. 29W222]|uniref:Uncharacterized protein n=1 Tax=Fulvivirga marina TaxID=2494733 RepID=A0A937G0X6_9BACT|nr:hypothetical protein [Fulvivirga marina]MBL6447960.1 hypothetical protein [Fulvivirga marina]
MIKLNEKPCHVIQVFSCSYEYDKKFREYGSRKDYVKWKDELSSGTTVGEEVVINRDCYENREGVLRDLIVLVDNNFNTYEDYLNLLKLNDQLHGDNTTQLEQSYKIYLRQQKGLLLGAAKPWAQGVEIFKLRFGGAIELFLNWDYWNVGEPKRQNYKIAELKEGVPVNILIDGKRDFSLSGRRKRVYIENNYIIEYKGIHDQVWVLDDHKVFTKKVPNKCKEVNLLKHLK